MDCVLPKFTRKEEFGAYIVTLFATFFMAVPTIWVAGLLDGRFPVVTWRLAPLGVCILAWITSFVVWYRSPLRRHKCDAKRSLTKTFITVISLELIIVFALVAWWFIGDPFMMRGA
jgi:hypothetical protein